MKPPVDALVVRLDVSEADVGSVAAMASQIPHASTLSARASVVVPAAAVRRGGVLRRWLGDRSVPVPTAVRCAALLVRGYVDIGADEARAWGYAPP
jgi:hypothetical protein